MNKLEKYVNWYEENNQELAELQEQKKRIFAEIRKAKDMKQKLAKWITEAGGIIPDEPIEEDWQLDIELEEGAKNDFNITEGGEIKHV